MAASGGMPNVRGIRGKNRQTKVHVVFNEQARREFLKGFKKRKDERRAKAREDMEIRLKEEKRRLKEECRDRMKKLIENQRTVPEIEHILKPESYDLPNHVITISTSTNVDFAGHDNLRLGLNKGVDETSDNDEEQYEAKDKKEADSVESLKPFDKKSLKKANKVLEKSKAFKMKQKFKQKKDRQKRRVQQIKNKKSKTKKRNLLKRNNNNKRQNI